MRSKNGVIGLEVEVLKVALILLPTNSSSRALKMAESNKLLICSSVHGDGIKGAGGNIIAAAGSCIKGSGTYGGCGTAGAIGVTMVGMVGIAATGIAATGIAGGAKAVGVKVSRGNKSLRVGTGGKG